MEIVLLDQEKTINQLIKKDIDSSIVEFIESELAKDEYSFIVTAENLKFAKEKMAELNKSIKFIDTFRKEKVNLESVAIDSFKDNVKTYIALIDTKREQIKKDVEVFENETKQAIEKELTLYADQLVSEKGIRAEFNKVSISDLIVLGSVTSKGNLTSKAKEAVNARALASKANQDRYDMRLMKLENLSYQNGLETSLTITHVQGIIMLENDEEYSSKLNDLINSEMERQETIKANLQKEANEKAEREAQQKILDKQDEIRKLLIVDCSSFDLDSTDAKIFELSNIDYSAYNEYASFAQSIVDQQIIKLQAHRKMLTDKASKLLEDIEKDNGLVHQESEKLPVEDGKRTIDVSIKLQFIVKDSITENQVLSKVSQMLSNGGLDDAIVNIEVV